MRSRTLTVALAVVVAACGGGGGDPIESAENCTELEAALETELEALADADNEDRNQVRERVMDKARDMRGDALSAGAETEAALCASMESLVLEIFDLDDFGTTTIQP